MTDLPSVSDEAEQVLVIKTGGIGAFVQSLCAFAAIRMHHGGARIILATERALNDFAGTAPYFNAVEASACSASDLAHLVKMRAWTRIYDLDCSPLTARVYKKAQTWRQSFGLDSLPDWSGTVKGCALPHENPNRMVMHASDRVMDQLAAAGVAERPPISMAWVSRAVGTFSLPVSLSDPFMILAIDEGGCNQARWSLESCIEMAQLMSAAGYRVVLVGEHEHESITEPILDAVAEAVSLCGQASHVEVVFLAWAASSAIGYDNGLMHVIATAGCKCVVLYDPGSDAALTGHRGPDVTILRRHSLDAIAPVEVMHCVGDTAVA